MRSCRGGHEVPKVNYLTWKLLKKEQKKKLLSSTKDPVVAQRGALACLNAGKSCHNTSLQPPLICWSQAPFVFASLKGKKKNSPPGRLWSRTIEQIINSHPNSAINWCGAIKCRVWSHKVNDVWWQSVSLRCLWRGNENSCWLQAVKFPAGIKVKWDIFELSAG